MKFSEIEAVVLDMDGVLWRGAAPLPGMQDMFAWLAESGTPFMLATNNSGRTPANYIEKLASMDVHSVRQDQIVTSGTATAAYLQTQYPAGTAIYIFGMGGLRQIIADAGYDVDPAPEETPAAVVAGVNFDLTYAVLRQAALHIRAGAALIGTNPDRTFPTPEGLVPGAGSLIAALETATDTTATVIGKPHAPMFEAALKALGTPADRTLMIGDRIDTDILGAAQVGMKTALLFTGVTTHEDMARPDNPAWPDVAYEGLPDVLKAWAGAPWLLAREKQRKGLA